MGSPLLIVAGVGTGKTLTLMSKYVYLLTQGVSPQNILSITFTKKAAEEMKSRAFSLLNGQSFYNWIGTFHSIANRILLYHGHHIGLKSNFEVLFFDDQRKKILEKIIKSEQSTENKFKLLNKNVTNSNEKYLKVPYGKILK